MLRGSRAGLVLAWGPAFYALYMYSQLALGGGSVRYPGNSERFFLLFLGLGLHLLGLVDVWRGEPTATEYLADPGVLAGQVHGPGHRRAP